ncbi:transglutaminaseTgpA domain-containing protein [Halorussus halophilus]|uniref:transglutaminaseTgpA domain-containing protein n=1 Tax=Halorussus halophilus TaxID=2650975 RepID=UPI001300D8A7|nr:transglutaminaseTgpA domain-containing protein [Halorussus halophilus]
MPDKPSSLVPSGEQSRDRLRALLAVCCVVAVLLAATVIPAVSTGGLGNSPLGSLVPQPAVDPFAQPGASGPGGGGAGGQLGALNPGSQTGVGGSLASEDGTSAFQSQNAETHFVVQSSVSSYWRTGSYDQYTGGGWKQTGEREQYDGPIEGGGIQGKEVRYQVKLNRSATTLPTVWRPNSVSRTESLFVTDGRAFSTDQPVSPGTTYTGVSHLPARDPNVLRTAGRDYPDRLQRRYTGLPDDTNRRVGQFTANLTKNADTPYAKAKKIESWLEANKNYSLNVSQPPDSDVASQFIFEMEEGYCEYYATSMTVMLRSQGIPARYVVGYSTGQQVGDNTYRVRGMNAHAWVEVYFPDVGWVRFDPTPGQERLESERQAYERQRDSGTYSPTESGSPGETFSANGSEPSDPSESGTTQSDPADTPGETTTGGPTTSAPTTGEDSTQETERPTTTPPDSSPPTTTTPSDSDSPPTQGSPQYDVSLNRTPVPGAQVEVTVTFGGSPVPNKVVRFNGDPVGETNSNGRVTATVPYAQNLTISVAGTTETASRSIPVATRTAPIGGLPRLSADAVASAPPPRSVFVQSQNDSSNGTRSYSLDTNASVAVSGDVVTNSTVVVTATVRGVPVRNAAVRLDGEVVGRTDKRGRARVTLPETPGNVTLNVTRESVAGEKTLELPALNVTAKPSLPLALPWTKVAVNATYGGQSASGVPVQIGGERVGTTDVNGTLSADLPFRNAATISVAADGQTRQTTVSGLLLNFFGVLVAVLALLGALLGLAARRGVTPRSVGNRLLGVARALPGLAVGFLFGAVAVAERALERARAGARTVFEALRDLWNGDVTVGELLVRLRAWAESRFAFLRERATAAADATISGRSGAAATDAADSDEPPESYRTIRAAWGRFLAATSVRNPARMTPGELATHAVERDDLPADAVGTLRDVFRDVEYGARDPDERLQFVESAITAIESSARPDEESVSSQTPANDGGAD